ncbi:MAPEG family protein [Hoeflea ulvae]|uniref:MAPEG family protein n=1 Tax=Hoeflea ulvae TaxID=2983764 RepID=A0ABT3YFV9_9HYPH|nr:MAPEG family protein [Hoeflea ulvae]MCY0094774.1 MAPEG family protein [Hoeflea ulvae]
MTSLFDAAPYLDGYRVSFVVLAVLTVMILVQNLMTAPLAFLNNEQTPGMPLRHDHSKLSFRAMRTYANSTESFPAFAMALLVAIVAGASPTLVNWLAVLHLAFRTGFWVVYYSGIGKVAGGLRTQCHVGGLAANLVLAGTAIHALLAG